MAERGHRRGGGGLLPGGAAGGGEDLPPPEPSALEAREGPLRGEAEATYLWFPEEGVCEVLDPWLRIVLLSKHKSPR